MVEEVEGGGAGKLTEDSAQDPANRTPRGVRAKMLASNSIPRTVWRSINLRRTSELDNDRKRLEFLRKSIRELTFDVEVE